MPIDVKGVEIGFLQRWLVASDLIVVREKQSATALRKWYKLLQGIHGYILLDIYLFPI
jgi:hypothetical protein